MSTAADVGAAHGGAYHAETRGRLLIVDDDGASATLAALLDSRAYAVDRARTGEDALRLLARAPYDAVLLNLQLVAGMALLSAARALQPEAQFILTTTYDAIDAAVEAVRLGAFAYLTRPVRAAELLMMLERGERDVLLRREVARLRRLTGTETPVQTTADAVPNRPASLTEPTPAPQRSEGVLVRSARAARWDLARLEREYILEILESTGGHRGRTAGILGIDRRTLYRKLREFGVGGRAGAGAQGGAVAPAVERSARVRV